MTNIGLRILALSAAWVLAAAAPPTVQKAVPSPRDLLYQIAELTEREWAALERGETVAKVLETDTREVAVAGAVRIRADSARLIHRYRDIMHLKRGAVVLDVGAFSSPPVPADLARAPFEEYNLDLRDCQPYDCRVRLAEQDIRRFHQEVNWRQPDWRIRSAAVWRSVLAGYAAAFARDGRRALPVFANKREPLSVPGELAGLVGGVEFVGLLVPELFAYMEDYTPPIPHGSEQILYWTKEDFGIRPVFRISNQVIFPAPLPPLRLVVSTNQIYADHYLDAALILTVAIDAPGSQQGFYLVSVSRARTRSLSGLLRSFVRSTVQSRSREALRKILTSARTSLETPTVR